MLNRYSWEGGVPPEGLGKLSWAVKTEREKRISLHVGYWQDPSPLRRGSHSWESEEAGRVPSRLISYDMPLSHLILKDAKEGPQLSTWPQGSTSVQTVIKYLEAAENSGQDLRYSRPWATSIPLGRSRWPSVEMPSLTFLLIIKPLPKTSFVTLEVQLAETCCLGLLYHDAPG